VSFRAPTLAGGTTAPDIVTLSITGTNSGGTASAPGTTTVTVNPLPDAVSATAQYRISKQRTDYTATSSVVSPNVVLKLQPYLTTAGTIYNPDPAAGGFGNVFTNLGNGGYSLTLIGAPEPALPPATPIVVTSSQGGRSPATAITTRQ
jgi:hypothetical protein